MAEGKRFVLIPAGGSGKRMALNAPKQFIRVDGKPIIVHSIEKFLQAIPGISVTVVLPENYMDEWEKIKANYLPDASIQITKGGATRFDSVKNGLELLPASGVVAIHDSVRPFATASLIMNCFASAEKNGSGVAAVTPKDSVFKVGKKIKSKDRNHYRLAQTPQCFSLEEIKKAYNQEYQPSFTDDASVWEAGGGAIHLVEGEYANIKITTQIDLVLAEAIIAWNNL